MSTITPQQNLNIMFEKIMKEIGLNSKEAIIYLASLKIGSQTASIVSEESGVNRTTVYDVFGSLIKKGLATKIDKGSATYFQVLDPQNLISYLERDKNEYVRKIEKQKNKIQEMLPAIQSLENPTGTKPKVQFYEGEKGMHKACEDTLNSTETLRAYANEEMHEKMTNFFPEYFDLRKKKGIFCKTIIPDNKSGIERSKHNKEEFRDSRLISHKDYSFSPSMTIFDDKIYIFSWQEKMAVSIKSKEIAELHKKMFDLLWSKLEK